MPICHLQYVPVHRYWNSLETSTPSWIAPVGTPIQGLSRQISRREYEIPVRVSFNKYDQLTWWFGCHRTNRLTQPDFLKATISLFNYKHEALSPSQIGSPEFGCALLPMGNGLGGSLTTYVHWDPLRLKLAPTAPFWAECLLLGLKTFSGGWEPL